MRTERRECHMVSRECNEWTYRWAYDLLWVVHYCLMHLSSFCLRTHASEQRERRRNDCRICVLFYVRYMSYCKLLYISSDMTANPERKWILGILQIRYNTRICVPGILELAAALLFCVHHCRDICFQYLRVNKLCSLVVLRLSWAVWDTNSSTNIRNGHEYSHANRITVFCSENRFQRDAANVMHNAIAHTLFWLNSYI